MGSIIPAVVPRSKEDLEITLARFNGLASCVQIDVIDGQFAAPASWPYTSGTASLTQLVTLGTGLPFWGPLTFDIDLMVRDPEETLDDWIQLGASRITVHAESTQYLGDLLKRFDQTYGHEHGFSTGLIEIGIAVNLSTDVSLIEPYLSNIDYVQFMGIDHIGHQGEPFDRRTVERVHAFHKKHPDVEIQVDGGVSRRTAPDLLSAGAHRLVVGSALLTAPDLKEEYRALEALTTEYGIYE